MATKIDQSRIKELLNYNPNTGQFFSKKSGKPAGWEQRGYIKIAIDGKQFYAHRLAWVYITGTDPLADIDHINQIGSDNRFINLREATRRENRANTCARVDNRLFVKGVSLHGGKFVARISVNSDHLSLGRFDTLDEAAHAYNKAAIQHFGDFACLNPIGADKESNEDKQKILRLESIIDGMRESIASMRDELIEDVAKLFDSSPHADIFRQDVASTIRSLTRKGTDQ